MTVEVEHKPWRLISIPISHYCEKARWGLERLGLPYLEEAHLLPFHRKVTEPLGGTTVPVLVTPDQVLTDSSAILTFLDGFAPESLKLYPDDPQLLRQVAQLEELLNQTLGPVTRQWAYYYVLQQPELLQALWCKDIPQKERAVYSRMLPKLKTIVTESLDISPTSAEGAFNTMLQVFEHIEPYLCQGKTFLLGERMTGADVTLAALAAPIILPEEHPMHLSSSSSFPRDMAKEVLAFRTTLVGEFVLRMYRDYR